MKISELLMPSKRKDRDIHMREESLPKDEIASTISRMLDDGTDYQRILRNVRDEYGIDAYTWARKTFNDMLGEK